MVELKDLMELARRIKDKDLRKKVIDIIKHPSLSNNNLIVSPLKFEESPASVSWHHVERGGLLKHTYAVTMMCISVAEQLEKVYGFEIDKDSLIAAALVHDTGKLWTMKKSKAGWEPSEILLDHTMLGTSELYARGFPEKVLHIVASHFGENGPTPPQTIEAYIFHVIDSLDAGLNSIPQDNVLNIILGQHVDREDNR